MKSEDMPTIMKDRRKAIEKKREEMEKIAQAFMARPEIPSTVIPLGPEFKKQYRAMLEERKEKEKLKESQQYATISLQETQTINLLDVNIKSVPKDAIDAPQAVWYNECFKKAQEERKYKYRRNATVQTIDPQYLSKEMQTDHVVTKENPAFVSIWDQYDSQPTSSFYKDYRDAASETSDEWDPRIKRTINLKKFKNGCLVAERVLSSNLYQTEQMTFKLKEEVAMGVKYKTDELWKCVCPEAMKVGKVNDICWNLENDGLMAVGYGDYSSPKGLVCCWCVKSPLVAERKFETDGAVTSLSFAARRTHLLAAATYTGAVLLIDITVTSGNIIVLNRHELVPLNEPLWMVKWYIHTDGVTEYEEIMSVGQAGKCGVGTYRNPSDLECEIQNDIRYKEIFSAHPGPVYGIKHSPFWNKVFATYGADSHIRIWVEGVNKPLVQINTNERAVEWLDWSPTHPSILASASHGLLATWDIGRKSATPLAKLKPDSPKSNFTAVSFSPKGNNVLVGCSDGIVKFYSLSEMPYPPFLQKEALKRAFDKVVEGKPELAERLEAIYQAN